MSRKLTESETAELQILSHDYWKQLQILQANLLELLEKVKALKDGIKDLQRQRDKIDRQIDTGEAEAEQEKLPL